MKRLLLLPALFFAVLSQATVPPPPPGSLKLMCIGDSITAGKGYCWRYHLWKKLQAAGFTAVDFVGDAKDASYVGEFDSDHEGYGGQTADKVAKNAAPAIVKYKPDIAFIHLGTNDFIMEKEPAPETAKEIGGIVDQVRAANPKVTVFIAKIPFVKQPEQGDAVRQLAAEKNTPDSPVQVVDLTADWHFEAGNDTVDYVHPNLNGALKIADLIFASLQPELQRRGLKPIPVAAKAEPSHGLNLALHKPCTADLEKPGRKANKATDGDWKTLWASDEKPPHWLQVDLQAPHELSGSGVLWDSAGAAYGYKLEVSKDAQAWTTVVDKSTHPSEPAVALVPQYDSFKASGIRYVRLTVTSIPNAPWTKYPASVRELEIYGK